jgi:hypothetical protein
MKKVFTLGLWWFFFMETSGCTPTVKVAPPEEPITINLNVKIEHEVRVKVERALDEIITEDSGLF